MKTRIPPLLSLLLCLTGCAGPAKDAGAATRDRARAEAAHQRYWSIQAENAQPRKP